MSGKAELITDERVWRRPGNWGVVERKPWAMFLLCYLAGIVMRLVGLIVGIPLLLSVMADMLFLLGIAVVITGYVLRAKTRKANERLR